MEGEEQVPSAMTPTLEGKAAVEEDWCIYSLGNWNYTGPSMPRETLDNASTGKVTDQPLGGVAPAVVLSSLPRNSLEIRTAKFPYLEGLL